jgi:Big-like domain-containing protein
VTATPVASVTVTPNGAAVQPGGTLQLTALTKDAGGSVLSGRTVAWTTASSLVATVSTTGLVTAVNPGTVTITATSEGVSGSATILTVGPSSNRFAFALANQPSSAAYTPSLADQFSSGGGAITIARQSDGVYDVTIPNSAKGAGQREVVLVSGAAAINITCQIGSWNTAGSGTVARVYCFAPTGVAADGQYSILLAESGTLAGRFGFTWADQPTADTYNPNPSWSGNSSGGAITITRTGTGAYTVRWAGLARTAGQLEETVMVGAYGSPDLIANVRCTDLNGAAADSRFVATIVDRGRASRRYGLTWADQPSSPIYTTTGNNYSRTSTSGAISIARTAAGTYNVRLGGQARTGTSPETVMVVSYGSTAYCQAGQWVPNGSDMIVTVVCFDQTGLNLVDTRFDVLLIE